jgi:fructose-specific phosphotransferase system IIC component
MSADDAPGAQTSPQTSAAASTPSVHRIVVLGSSGGNLRSQGGDDPASLLGEVLTQAGAAGFEVAAIQFVEAGVSMDAATGETPASLWELRGGVPALTVSGTLSEVDEAARRADARLAGLVERGGADALVLISADPDDTNRLTVAAAAHAGLVAAGTGGTSIARAEGMGVRLVSASGSTGTTSTTRAVSYIAGLASHWGVRYRPVLGGAATGGVEGDAGVPAWRRISIRGIMVASIPAFIALALVLAASKIPMLSGLSSLFDTLIAGLPVVVAAVAARRVSGLGEVGMVAGAVTGILSTDGGLIGGLVGGVLAGLLASWLLEWTLAHRFPATTANIVAGGLAGLLPGLLVHYALAPATSWLGAGVKDAISAMVGFSPLLAGAAAGAVIWFALMGGVYHAVILPLVLLEMGQKGHSFFGAIDMVCLVMVSLGITLANVVRPRTSGERALAGSGAAVNFFFGTFVEASYPFMFSDRRVFATAIGSATVAGAVVGLTGAEATAYVPAVVAPFVATTAWGMTASMAIAAGLAFAGTLGVNMWVMRQAGGDGEGEAGGLPARP